MDGGGWFALAGLRSRARVADGDGPLVTVAIIATDATGPAAVTPPPGETYVPRHEGHITEKYVLNPDTAGRVTKAPDVGVLSAWT